MAKFIYRMQNILDIKLKLESQAKIAYSQANAALREEEAKLLKLFERKNAYDNRAKELVEGKIDLLEIKKCRQAIFLVPDNLGCSLPSHPFISFFFSPFCFNSKLDIILKIVNPKIQGRQSHLVHIHRQDICLVIW